jgi:hypothetical protein
MEAHIEATKAQHGTTEAPLEPRRLTMESLIFAMKSQRLTLEPQRLILEPEAL